MVIHEDGDVPPEVSLIRKPLFEPKTYVIVENHVRELSNKMENQDNVENSELKLAHNVDNVKKNKLNKTSKKRVKQSNSSSSHTESDDNTRSNTTEISQSDIEELRSVYERCKAVVYKIEKKYGHLLNLDTEASSSASHNRKRSSEQESCMCPHTSNKKILFDEEGHQQEVETQSDTHICPKKPRKSYSEVASQNLQVEYSENEVHLSENLLELASILRDPSIEVTYRNKVINKFRSVKQEHLNEIRFNKLSLIEKLKTNPDEVFDFKGTNLATLNGYPQ